MTVYYRNKQFRFREEFFGGYLTSKTKRFRVSKTGLKILSLSEGKTAKSIARKLKLNLGDTMRFLSRATSKGILMREKPLSLPPVIKFKPKDIFNGFGLNAPDTILFEITNRCNLKCRYCYASSNESEGVNELTTQEVYRVIDEMFSIGVKDLIIGGGEPFLRDDLFKIIKYAKERDFYVGISSNGTLINKTTAQKVTNLAVDHIQISLDSSTSRLHNYFRKSKNFDKVVSSIKTLANEGITVWVETVVTKKNLLEVSKICKLCADLGVKRFKPTRMIPVGRAKKESGLTLNKENFKRLIINTRGLAFKYRKKLTVMVDQTFLPLIDPKFKTKRISWLEEKYFGCKAARTVCAILPDGTVTPCPFLRTKDFVGGNVREISLFEIWKKSTPFCKLRLRLRKDTECRSCPHGTSCNGGCRANASKHEEITLTEVLSQRDLACWFQNSNGTFSE